ncbi:MAG: T9SS type A sorting domain-containing protein [Ignavibacteria bacterium]|nr:T9SS type A sorting domain-containing protein [Ignavibacteria bacterium]
MKKYILSTVLALSLFGFLGFCLITNSNGDYRIYFPNRLPFVYQLHTSTPAEFIPAIEAGANEWTNIEACYFVFQRGANTNVSQVANDGVNLVYFDMQGVNFSDPNVIAFSSTFTTNVGGYQAVGSDLIWNGRDFTPGINGEPNKMDLRSVITHEFGHHLGLNHAGQPPSPTSGSNGCGPLNQNAVMWYAYSRGDTSKRHLTLDDAMGAISLYPVWVLQGTILDASTSLPLVGAKVKLIGTYGSTIGKVEQPYTNRWSKPGVPVNELVIDSTGQYVTAVMHQNFKVKVEKFGYYPDSAVINFNPPGGIGSTEVLNFDAMLSQKPQVTFNGTLINQNTNQGVQGTIKLESVLDNVNVGSYTTSSDGNFAFNVFGEEYYKMTISLDPPFQKTIVIDSIYIGGSGLTTNFLLKPTSIFVVLNDSVTTNKNKYINSLERLGVAYSSWDVQAKGGLPSNDLINSFSKPLTFLWVAGGASSSNLSQQERNLLIQQLESGSKLILAGKNIAEFSDTTDELLTKYIGVKFVTNNSAFSARGFAGDYIGNGLSIPMAGSGKDQLELTENAYGKTFKVYYYGTGTADTVKIGAVRSENSLKKWKTVFFGIGLEMVSDANCDTLLIRSLRYCADTNFVTKVEDVYSISNLPVRYFLHQNYPNPFNPNTIIRFDLPARSQVEVSIYDVNGKLVKKLINDQKEAGYHSIEWNGTDTFGKKVSSGIYFYRISAKNLKTGSEFVETKKMVLLK